MFITLEGPEGSGKTIQAKRLVQRVEGAGRDVVAVHEPGGTELGDQIRSVLLSRDRPPIDPWAEALLFSACRAQLVAEVVRPALARGALVVSDRFSDSTRAYQGGGRRLPRAPLDALIEVATGGLCPDLTVLLDVPPAVGLKRALGKNSASPWTNLSLFGELGLRRDWNRFEEEAEDFHQRVREAYLELARAEPHRWAVVDATPSVERVAEAVWNVVQKRLPS